MGMAVYKTGHCHHAGAVQNGFGLGIRGSFADIGDLAVFDADESTEKYSHLLIHGNGSYIGN